MIYNTIQYVVDNGIGTLTFNRPKVANGFNIEHIMMKVFAHCSLMQKARYSLPVAI